MIADELTLLFLPSALLRLLSSRVVRYDTLAAACLLLSRLSHSSRVTRLSLPPAPTFGLTCLLIISILRH